MKFLFILEQIRTQVSQYELGIKCPHAEGLNIPNSGLLMLIGCTHIFRLLQRHLFLHIIVCKTSMFSIAVEFFLLVHCSKSTKIPLGLAQT